MKPGIVLAIMMPALFLNACEKPHPISQSSGSSSSQGAQSQANDPKNSHALLKAFITAFGSPAPAKVATQNGDTLEYTPSALIQVAPGVMALVSNGTIPDGCHACYGQLSVHYLSEKGGEYQLLGSWLNIGGGAAYGQVSDWTIRTDIESNPVIFTSTEDGGQGCKATYHDIIALLPTQVKLRAQGIVTNFTYEPDEGEPKSPAQKVDGKIIPKIKDNSFDVIYEGTTKQTLHYQFYNGEYIASGETPNC